jgi:adenylosuccinate lyase
MDIEDNADALRLRQSLDLILERIDHLLLSLAAQAETWLEQPVMAFTHLQPAEPTTLGYRLALTAQDLLENSRELRFQRRALRGKGFKGAVGTSAAYADLFGLENLERFERLLSKALSLPFFPLATQVYPRQQDYRVLNALAGLGATLYRLAFDIRLLQSPPIGELAEPFRPGQVGSSAMPFKRNPVDAEKIDSLARLLAQYPHVAWDNAAHSLLERTLDDSANRRVILPESFLIADEILVTAIKIVDKLALDQTAMERNLAAYGPFAATERILAALVKAGADRQEMHERLRQLSMQAWEAVRQGSENPLPELVAQDPEIRRHLSAGQLAALFDVQHHTGDAVTRAKNSIDRLREELQGENTHE